MKIILGVLVLFFLFNKISYSSEKHGDIINKYFVEGNEYIVTQETTFQELWKIDSKSNLKRSIKKGFSIEKFAKECDTINEKPLFFATMKEYYFAGGWAEPTYLTIFDLNGKKVGIAPDYEYLKSFCKFYDES